MPGKISIGYIAGYWRVVGDAGGEWGCSPNRNEIVLLAETIARDIGAELPLLDLLPSKRHGHLRR